MKITESKLKQLIQESIKKVILEHRNIVSELDTACDIVSQGWESPDSVWWIKIEQRKKDFLNYNRRHNGQGGWWKQVNDRRDSTYRENHVGYVIVRGKTPQDAVNSIKNAVVHLHPWAARIYGSKIATSNGNMEGIIDVCQKFFARAYMTIGPRSMNMTLAAARSDKKRGLFKDREFHHRIGQAKAYDEPNGGIKWSQIRPWGMIDCDVDNPVAQKELEDVLKKFNITPVKMYLSHDGKHYIFNNRDAEMINYSFMNKYNSINRPGDPNTEFKGDANMIIYSETGK